MGRASTTPPPPPPPQTSDFSLYTAPSTLNIQAGYSATTTVTATSINGFSGTIGLTASAPAGWTVTLNPSSPTVTSGSSKLSTVSIAVPTSAQAGEYTFTLTGTSGSTSHSATITVNVASPSAPTPAKDFSITTSLSTLTMKPASSASLTATITPLNGFSSSVSFRTLVPSGWKAVFIPPWLMVSSGGSGSATVTITAPATAQTGTYTIWIIGVGNSVTRSVPIQITVQTSQPIQTTPSTPQNLRATAGNAQVALSWFAALDYGGSAINSYRIYRRTATTAETLLATVGNVLSFADDSVTNGQTYYYSVAAVNSVGESAKSNEISATPSAPTGGALNVLVETNSPTYHRGADGILTVTVKDGATGNTLQGASVTITFYNPTGAKGVSIVMTTDSSGMVKAGFGMSSSVATGSYTVTITVSLSGYQTTTTQATFIVT